MKKIKYFILLSIITIIITGCATKNNIQIIADDIVVEVGTELNADQIIELSIKDVKTNDLFAFNPNYSIKGLEAIDWQQPNSYKLMYEVCVDDTNCSSEDFEVNVVKDTSDPNAVLDVRKVYIDTNDIDIPVGYSLSNQQIIQKSLTKIIDSSDKSFSDSLSISGIDQVNWNKVGTYKVSIGGCDSELNCDEADTYIHVIEGITKPQIHIYTEA